MTFDCDGYEDFNGQKVRCVARYGHGIETVRKTLMDSCNDAIMQMSYKSERIIYRVPVHLWIWTENGN